MYCLLPFDILIKGYFVSVDTTTVGRLQIRKMAGNLGLDEIGEKFRSSRELPTKDQIHSVVKGTDTN